VTSHIVSTTTEGDVTVCSINGEVDLANAAQMHEELLRSVANDSLGLVVDLTDARYLDSAAVRALFELARELLVSRQSMGLVVATDSPLRRLVKITRVDEVAVLSGTVAECTRALREAARNHRPGAPGGSA
jgi:anti-anti-sigma factor